MQKNQRGATLCFFTTTLSFLNLQLTSAFIFFYVKNLENLTFFSILQVDIFFI